MHTYTADELSGMSFSELITLGEKIREDNIGGWKQNEAFEEAHKVFEMARVTAEANDSPKQLATVYGQIGLTHRHAGNYGAAEKAYKTITTMSDEAGVAATALRHLADLDYLRGYYAAGLQKAIEARKIAKKENRSDLVWFTHGVVKILIAMLAEWLPREKEDLKTGLNSPSASDAQKKAWETGYYGSAGKIFLLEPFGFFKAFWEVVLNLVYYGFKLDRGR